MENLINKGSIKLNKDNNDEFYERKKSNLVDNEVDKNQIQDDAQIKQNNIQSK